MEKTNSKCLIAYFSRKGNNYVNGSIVSLAVGNTATVANKIKELTNGDLFEIATAYSYPSDYLEATKVAKAELQSNARPKLSNSPKDINEYPVIFLGYPNWWGTFPMAVSTFLESYDFSDKTIIPFCTHEGSGLGTSEENIKRLCPNANVRRGIAIKGSAVANSEDDIKAWIKSQL